MRAVFVQPSPVSGQWVAARRDAAIGEQQGFVLGMEEGRQLGAVPTTLWGSSSPQEGQPGPAAARHSLLTQPGLCLFKEIFQL